MKHIELNEKFTTNKKVDFTIFFFFSFFMILCFADANSDNSGNLARDIYVFHFNVNATILTIGICVLFTLISLFKNLKIDKIALFLLYSAVLGTIPFAYVENVNSYWGNYLPLVISFFSYNICVQSKVDFSEKIYKIICLVCVIVSIQVIETELNYFSGISFGNFSNVSIKAFMNIPIGSSNLIAAYLLPMIVFIISFKRNKLTLIVSVLSMFALIFCRSKNALSLEVFIVSFIVLMKVYSYIIKDKSVNSKAKLLVLSVVTAVFGSLSIMVFKLVGLVISDLAFSYYSPYSNYILNYLDTISSGRIVVFHNELIRFTDHIFLGNGFGYNLGQTKSHNWIIEVLVQRGFIGAFIYVFCITYVIKNGLKFYNDRFTRASINLLIIILIQGLFEITVFTIGIDFLIWSISGFLIARTKLLKKQNDILNQALIEKEQNNALNSEQYGVNIQKLS